MSVEVENRIAAKSHVQLPAGSMRACLDVFPSTRGVPMSSEARSMWRGRTPGRENANQRDHRMSRMVDIPGHRVYRGITGNARAQARAPTHPIPSAAARNTNFIQGDVVGFAENRTFSKENSFRENPF